MRGLTTDSASDLRFLTKLLLFKTLFLNDGSVTAESSCGAGTVLDPDSKTCFCDDAACYGTSLTDPEKVFIGGLFDTSNFDWGAEIFNFTVSMINNHEDGWHDDILADGTTLEIRIENSGCDPQIALPAYWDLKTNWGQPLHGVVGCRCSGASAAVARVAALENVPVVSMSASSSRLSDTDEFSSFSRLVGPDDARGQVGALVSLLRSMGWDRVSVLTTDTQYTKDLATAFGSAWVGHHAADESTSSAEWNGEVAYSHTVGLDAEGDVDMESVQQALNGAPTDDPRTNSRVILLLAHHQHAFPILEMARQVNFQPETIWVGTEAWSGRRPANGDTSWMPDVPGYLGLVPYRNRDAFYSDFLARLQADQRAENRPIMKELPDYAAETMVDSLLALAMALSEVSPDRRGDGRAILSALRNVTFPGVSGPVQFTAEGDRASPRYTVMNWRKSQANGWTEVGQVGPSLDSASVRVSDICWAGSGCGLSAAPSEKYPVPPMKLPVWVWVIMPVCIAIALALGFRYWRSHRKKKMLKSSINEMRAKIDAMHNIDTELEDLEKQVKKAKQRQASLIQQRVGLQETPSTWSASTETLVEVIPEDEQYWVVSDRLRETMADAWISRVWRVQNHPLWNYYSFHKNRLSINGVKQNERSVWHGTSSLDPAMIYNDQQDGFMMQFSQNGYWGRGIYFAHKSSYSHSYSFRPHGSCPTERPDGKVDEREMFLAKLLAGNEVLMDRDESSSKAAECRALTVPPTDPATDLRFDTVTGYTAGSQVWIVYENGRAYPDYLVRFYRGARDTARTPFATKDEAAEAKEQAAQPKGSSAWSWFRQSDSADQAELGMAPGVVGIANGGGSPGAASWEYLDATSTWKPYDAAAQAKIEAVYQEFAVTHNSSSSTVQIKSGEWTYEIDVNAKEQTNIQHQNHTKRKIRRQLAQ